MSKRLLVLTGASSHNVLSSMSASLSRAFEAEGFEPVVVTADPLRVEESVRAALPGGRFDAVFAFASFGAEAQAASGGSIYDQEEVPFIGWNVDHPCYHYSRIAHGPASRNRISANPSHGAFVSYALGDNGANPAQDLALLPGIEPVADLKPYRLRKSEVLLAASWLGPPQRWWAAAEGTPAFELIDGLVSRLGADPDLQVLDAFKETTQELAMELTFDASTFRVISEVLSYIRRVDRIALVTAIAKAKLPCTLAGSGWPSEIAQGERLRRLPNLEFDALNRLYGDYQVVLNLNAANGGCERALGAMAAGAAVVSDYNPLLDAEFAALGGLRFFDRSNPEDAISVIGDLLEGQEGRSIADLGFDLASEGHGWGAKVRRLAGAFRFLSKPQT